MLDYALALVAAFELPLEVVAGQDRIIDLVEQDDAAWFAEHVAAKAA